MDLGVAFLLITAGPAVAVVLLVVGGLMIWRGTGVWLGAGAAMVVLALALLVLAAWIYIGLAQVNWSL